MAGGNGRCMWTFQEDVALRESALKYMGEYWNLVAEDVRKATITDSQKKSAKQCRERWNNQINPAIKSSPLTKEEIEKIFLLHKKFGNRWSKISQQMTGRTDNIIKNFFLCKLRKVVRCVKKGIPKMVAPTNESELLQVLYLMDYLYKFYISPERTKNVRMSLNPQTRGRKNSGDQYINKMIGDKDITATKLSIFTKSLLDSVKFSINKTSLQEYDYLMNCGSNAFNSDSCSLHNLSQLLDSKNESLSSTLRIFKINVSATNSE